MPCQCNTRESPSKLKRTSPQAKINVTSKSPVGDISVVTLIRTDTTLDHSQKAEKVWCIALQQQAPIEFQHDHGVLSRPKSTGEEARSRHIQFSEAPVMVGSSSQADYLMRNAAMDDSIGGS